MCTGTSQKQYGENVDEDQLVGEGYVGTRKVQSRAEIFVSVNILFLSTG